MYVPIVSVLGGTPALNEQALSRLLYKEPIGGASRPVWPSGVLKQHNG